MFKFLFALVLLVHGCFALSIQHYFPSKLVGFLAPKKAASLHQLFPLAVYPPDPPRPGGYAVAAIEVLTGFFILKHLARL